VSQTNPGNYTVESGSFTLNNPTKEQARAMLLDHIDVLVDGPFEYEKRDLTLAFRGSSNQRIIDVQASLSSRDLILKDIED
jgi:hypothetical protein